MKALLIIVVFIFIVLQASLVISCKHEPLGLDKFDTVCFASDVLPIFQNSCGKSGCHDGSEEGFDARTYQSIMQSITAGNANKSKAYSAITSKYFNTMPPSPSEPLTKDQRTLIALWINQGAMNTNCDTVVGGVETQVDTICFSQNILPILLSSCAVTGCHDLASHKEGLNLSSYSLLMSNSGSIVPFTPNSSKVYKSIIATSGEDRMPPSPRALLSSTQISQFKKWIEQGALNSDCPNNACDTTGTISFTSKVWPIVQNNCLGCHNTSTASGGIDLNGYAKVKIVADNIRNSTSVLSGVVNQVAGFVAMPPNGSKMDICSIRTIELWIQQGKSNN